MSIDPVILLKKNYQSSKFRGNLYVPYVNYRSIYRKKIEVNLNMLQKGTNEVSQWNILWSLKFR
jgi:hypothetical protein